MTDIPAIQGGGGDDSAELSDGDLVRLARDGDPVAFRLLVERHQPMVRARARWLCANPSDVDDVVQESFLHAFIALDRLEDPERFAAWLAGVVFNVCRNLRRRRQLTLVPTGPNRCTRPLPGACRRLRTWTWSKRCAPPSPTCQPGSSGPSPCTTTPTCRPAR